MSVAVGNGDVLWLNASTDRTDTTEYTVFSTIEYLLTRTHAGDEIANVNFYVVRPEATRIR